MFRNILVAVDGSPQSSAALQEAGELATATGGRLTLLSVYDLAVTAVTAAALSGAEFGVPPLPVESSAGAQDQVRLEAEQLVQEARAQVPTEVPCEAKTVEGPPAKRILAEAEAGTYDLIMMGSRGRGTIGSIFLGSVSSDVLHNSPIPVLIVRHGHDDDADAAPSDRETPA